MTMIQYVHIFRMFFVFEQVFSHSFGNRCTLGTHLCCYLVLMLDWYHSSNNRKYVKHCNNAFSLGQIFADLLNIKFKKVSGSAYFSLITLKTNSRSETSFLNKYCLPAVSICNVLKGWHYMKWNVFNETLLSITDFFKKISFNFS